MAFMNSPEYAPADMTGKFPFLDAWSKQRGANNRILSSGNGAGSGNIGSGGIGAGISSVTAPQIGNVPQAATNQINFNPNVRAAMVQAPGMQSARDAYADPYQAQQIAGVANVNSQQMNLAGLPSIGWGNVAAQQGGASGLGNMLNERARQELALGGQLSQQDMRESEQTARTAFADRGMGRSNGAIFAEALNRDQYSRQRANERQTFAQGVETLDQNLRLADAGMRQQAGIVNAQGQLTADEANAGNQMQGMLANQATGLQAALANQQMGYNTQTFNAGAMNQAGQFNADLGLRASMANQGADLTRATTMYQGDLQSRLANQNAQLQAGMANQDAGLRATLANQQNAQTVGLANQGTGMQGLLANQDAGLRAMLANQGTQLGRYQTDMGAATSRYGVDANNAQDRWNFRANAGENRAINSANMQALQQLLAMYN